MLDMQNQLLNRHEQQQQPTASTSTANAAAAPELFEDILERPFAETQEFEDWLAEMTNPENSQARRRLVSFLFIQIPSPT